MKILKRILKLIKRLIVLTMILAVPAACGWYYMTHVKTETKPVAYRTAKITRGNIVEAVTATGSLSPMKLVSVGTQVSGQVSKVYIKVGDTVKKGQLMAEIDPSLLVAQAKQSRSSLEMAKSNYDQAARDLKRTKMLLEKDYVAKVDLEHAEQALLSAKSGYESAQGQVDRDEANLGYAKIIAPMDGVVIEQEASLGETLAASFATPNLFKIQSDLDKMKINTSLSEADVSKVKVGMPVIFTVDAYPNKEFTGTVTAVNLTPNSTGAGPVMYTVETEVENKDKQLFPGMNAYVRITLFEQKNVMRIPPAALRFTPPDENTANMSQVIQTSPANASGTPANSENSKLIYLLRNGKVVPALVKIGVTDESYVEISSEGLTEEDAVIIGISAARRH